ncbi:MAG TPA: hypothetical protein VFX19_01805 [Dehalococcoidia bacterium]|nr:hypothetical protein [Dehalococcoidia bacterium]
MQQLKTATYRPSLPLSDFQVVSTPHRPLCRYVYLLSGAVHEIPAVDRVAISADSVTLYSADGVVTYPRWQIYFVSDELISPPC